MFLLIFCFTTNFVFIFYFIKILSLIEYPFLVRTDGFNQDKKILYVVLELVNGGELFTYLSGVGKFPLEQAL